MTEAMADPGRVWTDDAIRHPMARLYRSAFGMTRNAADAEDLVEETFAKAFTAARRFKPGTNPAGWLYRIMFNTFVTCYRKRQRELLLAADSANRQEGLAWPPDAAGSRSAEEHALGHLVHAEIVTAIGELPPRRRLLVYLADVKA